jgi:predicted RNA-binding protein with EMAP domain
MRRGTNMKRNHPHTSFDIELLAKLMRERALLIEAGDIEDKGPQIDPVEIELAKKQKKAKLDELKKVYFNAGRWAAGATDWTARKAYEKVGKQ